MTTWSLVTAPDERERCMVVEDAQRCTRPTQWLVGDLAGPDYAYVCADHLAVVRRPGDLVESAGGGVDSR